MKKIFLILIFHSLSYAQVSDTFTINTLPILIVNTNQDFCAESLPKIMNLESNNPSTNWYDGLSSTTPLLSSELLENSMYYYGQAFNTSTGCVSERIQVYVTVETCEFIIPDGFSPNGDGVNDVYNIVNGDIYYPNYMVEVYDRYGTLISSGKSWDGTNQGRLLPSSIYFVILYYNDGRKDPTQHRIYLNK